MSVMECAAKTMRDMGCTNRQLALTQSNALSRAIPAAKGVIEAIDVLLRDYEAVHGDGDMEMQPSLFQARKAIAKAKGESA